MKALKIAVTMTALAIAPAMWAQQPEPPQAKAPAVEVESPAQENLTGCLANDENAFTLRTSSGMVQLTGDDLEGHVGKTIRVTGSRASAAGKPVFEVTEVEVVSPNCQS